MTITDHPTLSVPLKSDQHGVIRVSGTRVSLDSIIHYYQQGFSAERLHEGFDTVPLAAIYAVIAFYHAHRDDVDAYLQQQEEEADQILREWQARYPPKVTRETLLARREAMKRQQESD